MTDEYGNQTEEEVYAQGGEVCACCGSLNCQHTVDDTKVTEEMKNERSKE
jgi:hypothetical protein